MWFVDIVHCLVLKLHCISVTASVSVLSGKGMNTAAALAATEIAVLNLQNLDD